MRQLQTPMRLGFLMSALGLMGAPSAALAQDATCTTDNDCEHGYTCEEVGGGCAAVDCAEGSNCVQPECETILGCVPARDCAADSDCIEGWKCITREYADCGDVAQPSCAEGEECVKPEPADCGTIEESACVAPWNLPCETAADCGVGFDCIEQIWACDGGSGSNPLPAPDPGAGGSGGGEDGFAPPADDLPLPEEEEAAPPPECESEPSGVFVCVLIDTPCVIHADCGAGLTCQEQQVGVSCGGSTPSSGGDSGSGEGAGSGGADGAGDAPPDDPDAARAPSCEVPEPTFACAPPSYAASQHWGGFGVEEDRGGATAGGDPLDDETSNTGTDGDGEEPPVLSGSNGHGAEGESASGDMMEASSGCSAMGGSRASGSALFMLLAVLGLVARRRSLRA